MTATSSRPVSLLVCGDICPTPDTRALFDLGDPKALFGGLADKISAADVAIANLECVLSQTARPATKAGPVLTGKPQDADLLAQAGFNLVGCANNHIKDCGASGVNETLAACKVAGLRTTGAGATAIDAAEPALIDVRGYTLGIFAVAEHEFNAAGLNTAGAHIFDPLEDLDRLRGLKAACDFVIVLYHGGIEYYPYPSPALQKTCRALVRNGADLVLCQHSHVIGTFEQYKSGHILYGQGNAAFGYRPKQATWNEGFAVSVILDPNTTVGTKGQVDLLPIGCDATGKIDLLPAQAAQDCLTKLAARSQKAEDPTWVAQSWVHFCATSGRDHLPYVFGLGIWLIHANRILKGRLMGWLFNRRQRMTTLNVIRCDAHREVVLTTLYQSLPFSKN